MTDQLNIPAKHLRVGQQILAEIYDECVPLFVTDIEPADALGGGWYREELADTLDAVRGARLRITGVTLDGLGQECLLVYENETVLLVV